MFSMGNREEKARIARMVEEQPPPREDCRHVCRYRLFFHSACRGGCNVHAMEINPVAFGYLVRSIEANNLSGRITPSLGDCRQLLSGTYDRIVMGHFDAVTMLPDALRHAAPGSVIHVHSIGPVEEQVRAHVEGAGFSATIHVHKVKKYRPHAWHMVQDVYLA